MDRLAALPVQGVDGLEGDLTDEKKVVLANSIRLCTESIEVGKGLLQPAALPRRAFPFQRAASLLDILRSSSRSSPSPKPSPMSARRAMVPPCQTRTCARWVTGQ